MGGKLNLYALGQGGVNTDKTDVQLKDDECRQAQNAIYAEDAEGALAKRGSLQRLNGTAMNAGADVLAIVNVALPNPFSTASLPRKYLYLGAADLDNWTRTADGVTWVPQSLPDIVGWYDQDGVPTIGLPPLQPIPGRLLYVSGAGALDDWRMFDGTSDQFVLKVPAIGVDPEAYTAGASGYHLGDFYFGTIAVTNPRVYKFNLTTGDLKLIVGVMGPNYYATAIQSFVGQMFVLVTDGGGAAPQTYVYRCDPANATAWIVDSALLGGIGACMTTFKGNLYVATGSRNAAASMNIYKRTPSGVYSTVYTDATPWNVRNGGAIIEFADTLFAYMGGTIVKSTDGAAWSAELDVFTTYGSFEAITGVPLVFNGELYWPFGDDSGGANARVLKRTAAGAWSVAYGPADFKPLLTVFEVP